MLLLSRISPPPLPPPTSLPLPPPSVTGLLPAPAASLPALLRRRALLHAPTLRPSPRGERQAERWLRLQLQRLRAAAEKPAEQPRLRCGGRPSAPAPASSSTACSVFDYCPCAGSCSAASFDGGRVGSDGAARWRDPCAGSAGRGLPQLRHGLPLQRGPRRIGRAQDVRAAMASITRLYMRHAQAERGQVVEPGPPLPLRKEPPPLPRPSTSPLLAWRCASSCRPHHARRSHAQDASRHCSAETLEEGDGTVSGKGDGRGRLTGGRAREWRWCPTGKARPTAVVAARPATA
ncbi:hypothetical protein BS78_07G062700 [Paspalum vaginatum]|nr:hypothetical protein BS78_07G062700 [Paspalum vaginatum]